ncbi:uncharacterized protein JCM6883_007303 [Sporobolomyces salmoneus]|uniref:uncharacterized protein n=1 Tax=Sporobolomyces salmoneus TaxID=183962 RepID=UPI003175D385
MPVPFIPPELIGDILAHFHLADDKAVTDNEKHVMEAVSRSTSLVCRDWRPLGQALRWSSLSIKPRSASSLVDHFVTHPHLTSLVQRLKVQSPVPEQGVSGYDGEAYEDEAEQDHELSFKLLSQLTELRVVELELVKCVHLEKGVILCSTLPKLESVNLLAMSLRITSELKTALRTGFPVLKYLGLKPVGLVQTDESAVTNEEKEEEEDVGVVSTSSKSSLQQVALLTWIGGGQDPATTLFDAMRSAFDWSQVKVCAIGGLYLVEEILLDLVRQPNLVRLQIVPGEHDLGELFSTIVTVLPYMTNLRLFEVEPTVEEDDILESPVEIWDFLDLIPSNLKIFKLPQIAFDPDPEGFYEFASAWTCRRQGKKAHRVFVTLASADRPLILYEYDTEDGKEWCE